jgi:negative regulator of flagellin synthesis FlgM
MKINSNINSLDIVGGPTPKTNGAPKTSAAEAAPSSTSISLSDVSSTLATLEAKLSAEPAFDAAKVQEIKDAIRSGEFRVNAEAVADKLIAGAREFLNSK